MMQPYDPTPEEIRAACAEIRAGWSDHELYRRSFGKDGTRPPVEIEIVSERDLFGCVSNYD